MALARKKPFSTAVKLSKVGAGRRGTARKRGKPYKFRSGFEEEFWKANSPIIALDYEPFWIEYVVTEHKKYLPDFVVRNWRETQFGQMTILETKGYFTSSDRKKIKALVQSNPKIRVIMVFQRDNYLTKAKKKRYSDWCQDNSIDYCIGTDLSKIVWCSNPNAIPSKKKQ